MMKKKSNIKATIVKAYPKKHHIYHIIGIDMASKYLYNRLILYCNKILEHYRKDNTLEDLNLKEFKSKLYELTNSIDTSRLTDTIIENVISYLVYRTNYAIINIKKGLKVGDFKIKPKDNKIVSIHMKKGFEITKKDNDKVVYVDLEGVGILKCRGREDFDYSNPKFITVKYNKKSKELFIAINK